MPLYHSMLAVLVTLILSTCCPSVLADVQYQPHGAGVRRRLLYHTE